MPSPLLVAQQGLLGADDGGVRHGTGLELVVSDIRRALRGPGRSRHEFRLLLLHIYAEPISRCKGKRLQRIAKAHVRELRTRDFKAVLIF